MRIRLPLRRTVLFGAMLLTALIALLPLRLVLGVLDSGLAARAARGSVWAGRLEEAQLGAAALGDLDARLAPAPLLLGRGEVRFARETSGPDRLRGAIGLSRTSRALDDVSGAVAAGALFAPLPIATLELADLSVRFEAGQCARAEGAVTAVLAPEAVAAGLPARLSGRARCDRGALLLPLAGGAGGVALRVAGNGRWEAELRAGGGAPQRLEGRF
jgi:general secretion pathway protein N